MPILFARHALVAALCVSLVACAAEGPSPSPSLSQSDPLTAAQDTATVPTADTYNLGPGDKIAVTVFNEENLSGEFQIDGNGIIAFPLIGTIEAKGKTARQVEEAIVARLNQGYIVDPRVSVEVLTYRPFYILGEVRTPGSYPYVNGMTVLNAVALAGGYTYRAKTSYALVKRHGSSEEVEVDPTTLIYPGDVVTVKERYF